MKRHAALLVSVLLFAFSAHIISVKAANPILYAGSPAQLNAALDTANTIAGSDTILLTANITLTGAAESNTTFGSTGLDPITSDVTIDGQGHKIARASTAPGFRIFRVQAGSSLTLVNLTVSGGLPTSSPLGVCDSFLCGGGIYSEGTVVISNCTFSGNKADTGGGLFQYQGDLTVTNSTFSDNKAPPQTMNAVQGAGIANYVGSVTIRDSIFSNNVAGEGGGVYNLAGSISISNSTFSNNTASGGGAVASESSDSVLSVTNSTFFGNSATSDGGAIYTMPSQFWPDADIHTIISNSTFFNNTAVWSAGAIWLKDGSALLINNTISGNSALSGGGLYMVDFNFGVMTVKNSIIVNNAGGNCAGNINATITGISSLVDDDTCTDPGFMNSPSVNLGTLADNGGSTQTIMLGSGSSAFDIADNTTCLDTPISGFDQRGVLRGFDANGLLNNPAVGDCDTGSAEFGGAMRTVQFASSISSLIPTSATSFPVTVTLDAPLDTGYAPIQAYIWVSGGTAVAGQDYMPFGVQTVTFNPTDTIATIALDLLNAPLITDKTIILSFATKSGHGFSGAAQLGTRLTHTVTLKATPPNAAPELGYSITHTPILTWNRIANAIGYEIQIDTDSAFVPPYTLSISSIPPDTLTLQTSALENGRYYWRVRAMYSGDVGAWSPVQSFRVLAP